MTYALLNVCNALPNLLLSLGIKVSMTNWVDTEWLTLALQTPPSRSAHDTAGKGGSCKQTTWARQFIQKIWEFSMSACHGKMIRNLTSYQWSIVIACCFSLKNCHGWERYSELVSGQESTFSPDCWIFWTKYLSSLPTLVLWLLAFEQGTAGLEFDNT